jgi:DNA-binding transcriptional regulator YiaG
MSRSRYQHGPLPPERTDEEIRAAVADDADEAPVWTDAEATALRERDRARDRYGVDALIRSLGISGVEVANRLRVPWTRVRGWQRGQEEPDAEARAGLEALDADPALRARREETRRIATEVLADQWGVVGLRQRLGLDQAEFAARYGVPLATLRGWEDGSSEPERAAKVLLAAIAADPELVARAARHAGDRAFLVETAA